MKKLLFIYLLLVGSKTQVFGQSYTSSVISGINEIAGTGSAVTLTSSAASSTSSGSLPIGFSFNFYGNSYTNFYINPNGTLSFGSANQNYLKADYAPLNIIPSTNLPNNFIGFAFINPYDNYPQPNVYPDYSTANISYFTSGTAPNRILVVNFKNVKIPATYSFPDQFIRTQVQLFESDGKIEVHNTNSSATNSSEINRLKLLQIGVENIDGTNGTAATCPANWNLDNKTVRFTYCSVSPSTPTNVTSSTILCTTTTPNTQSINLSAVCTSGSPVWYPASGSGSCILSASSVLASTTVTPTSTTSYKVRCENNGCNSNYVNTTISVGAKIADPTNVTADQFICTAGSSVNLVGSCTNSYPLWYDASNTLLTAYNSYTNYNSLYNASVSVSPSASTTYTIKCENTTFSSCSGSKTVNVGVSNLTNPSSVTSSQTICAGLPLTLQGTCATGTKEWGLWNGNTYAVFTNTNISPTATSYYQIRCVSGTCNTYQNVTITVIGNPTSPSSITSNPTGTINIGSSVSLTANGCSSGNTIKWNDNTTANPKVFNAVSSATYTAKCINSNNCESIAASIAITVVCPVAAPISITASTPLAIGTGESTTLTATCVSGQTIKWEDNSTVNPRTVSPTQASTIYSARCVSNVCESNASTITITIGTRPQAPVIVGASSVCAGSSLGVSVSGCPINTYIYWYKNSETTSFNSTYNNSSLTVNPSVNTTYFARCNVSSLESQNSNSVSVTVNTLPAVPNNISVVLNSASSVNTSFTGSCTTGNISWFSKVTNNYSSYPYTYVETSLGSGNTITMDLINPDLWYYAKCTEATSGCSSSTNVQISSALTGVANTAYIGNYFSGNFSGTASTFYYGVQTVEFHPVNQDAGTFYFQTGTMAGSYYSNASAFVKTIERVNNNWEIWDYEGKPAGYINSSLRKYHTRDKYTSKLPPCSAVWVKDVDNSEATFTISGFCDTAAPIPCSTTLNFSSSTIPSDDISTGTITKQASSAAGGKITATNKITGTAKVTYQAKTIELKNGFKADNGTVFKAEVGGCN
jgi:hypothetical protein